MGTYIHTALLKAGYRVRLLVRRSPTQPLLPDTELADADITDATGIALALAGCHAVVHAAGLVSFAGKERTRLRQVNMEGTANIVNTMLAQPGGPKRLVHISSVAAIRNPGANERTGATPADFSGYYGFSKHLAEQEVFRGRAEGLEVALIRPSVILGTNAQVRSSGSILQMAARPNTLAPPGILHWVSANDVADAVVACLKAPAMPEEPLLLDATPLSWHSFYRRYRQALGIQGRLIAIPTAGIKLVSFLAPLASMVYKGPMPTRQQLISLMEPKQYGSNAPTEQLLGCPLRTIDETINLLTH